MKDTPQKPSKKSSSRDVEKAYRVRVPQDFIFLLMDHMVSDLSLQPLKSGDMPILAHPDVNLSEVKTAVRKRDLRALLEATGVFSAQRIAGEWSDRPEIAFGLYQLHTLLKKFPISGDDNATNAYKTFCSYEAHCERFNRENWRTVVALNERHPDFLGFLEEIREDIRRCIGDEPPLQRIYDGAQHGPGTALGLISPMVTNYFKWSSLPYTISPKALPYARAAIESDPRWIGALMDSYRNVNGIPQWSPIDMSLFWDYVFETIDYCKYSTVPKAANTDRSIGVEPTLNVFLQLGCDRVIRKALRQRWGIDLNTQLKNQHLCQLASISNDDATIDLKGASDCVAIMAAYLLLPTAWFDLLMDLRSENIRVSKKFTGGKRVTYPLHKISAMGNGYTFALESLIFAALSRYVMRTNNVRGNLAIFGDDIIVPRVVAPQLIKILDLFGFMVNKDKTFITGPFRESCGVDCLNGINIRPFFLKTPVVDVSDIWYISNSLFELERRLPELWEVSFAQTRSWLYKYIPETFRDIVGPPSESLDTYLFVERSKYDRNGVHKHLAIVPQALTFNDRAPGWFFRKLMVSLRGHPSDAQERLNNFYLRKILKEEVDIQAGWKTGGTTRHNQKVSNSAFDVTLRGVVKHVLITRQVWKK